MKGKKKKICIYIATREGIGKKKINNNDERINTSVQIIYRLRGKYIHSKSFPNKPSISTKKKK